MQTGDPDSLIYQSLNPGLVSLGHVPLVPVAVHDQRIWLVIPHPRGRPSIVRRHLSHHIKPTFIQATGQQQATRPVFVGSVAMALPAGQKQHLFLVTGFQLTQPNVAEARLHRRPPMQLKRNEPAAQAIFIRLGKLGGDHAVDLVDALVSVGDDVVLVPTVRVQLGEKLIVVPHPELCCGTTHHVLLTTLGQDTLVLLPVSRAGPSMIGRNIRLVTAHNKGLTFHRKTTVLNPAVMIANLELNLQLEVSRLATLPNEKRITLGRNGRGCFTDDRTIIDTPETGIAVPPVQRRSIKD